MASDHELLASERLLLTALRCAIRGDTVPWTAPLDFRTQNELFRLADAQVVLPLVAHAVYQRPELFRPGTLAAWIKKARLLSVSQAARTGEFLELYEILAARGLHPAVLKGLVCRNLYPNPEQRASTDEDLFISREELLLFHDALLEDGLTPVDPAMSLEDADEAAYWSEDRGLYLELHLRLFPSKSDAYGDFNRFFDAALADTEEIEIYGHRIRTLCPTDHLTFLLCHACKHILHGGAGIRQFGDICLFAEKYADRIDWPAFLSRSRELGLESLLKGIFRIGQEHLGIPAPDVFSVLDVDELPLLADSLRGGLFGADDPDRLHSSTLTLDAVAASKTGRRTRGALHSLFLPASSLVGRFPYLRKRPWLLPVAWTQRAWLYLTKDKPNPGNTLRIGRERIELLKQYDLLQ